MRFLALVLLLAGCGPKTEPVAVPPGSPAGSAKVAIVIDDLGSRRDTVESFLALGVPMTFAVIPREKHSRELAERVRAAGQTVLLHLPMEPLSYPRDDPGQGALYVSLSPEEIRRRVDKFLADVPGIAGVNNHMGSKFTEDEFGMRVVLERLKAARLFFLDSRTSEKSCGPRVARELGVPVAQNQFFLDVSTQPADVAAALEQVRLAAHRDGSAIAIGHVHWRATADALAAAVPKFREDGVEFVPVSVLVR